MKKIQIIHLLQFLVARVLVGVFVVFIMKESFIDFVLKYRLFLIVISLSYFYYYSIQYETDKKFEVIRNVLIRGNVYLFAHIFFRPLLNISHYLFMLLGLLIFVLWFLSTLKIKGKLILQILDLTVCFLILTSGLVFLYPNSPDLEGFIASRNNELYIYAPHGEVKKTDAYINLKTLKKSEDINIISSNKELSESVTILYPSLLDDREEQVGILTSYGDVILIFPQSEVYINIINNKLNNIILLNGKLNLALKDENSRVIYTGLNSEILGNKSDFVKSLQKIYNDELILYLKNQLLNDGMSVAYIDLTNDISGLILDILSKIFPVSFSDNLDNYERFQTYFQFDKLEKYMNKNMDKGVQNISVIEQIKSNIDIGKDNTYFLFNE